MNIDTSTPARRAMHRTATLRQPCMRCIACKNKQFRMCVVLNTPVDGMEPTKRDWPDIHAKPQSEPVAGMAFPEPQGPVGGSLMPTAMSDIGNEPLLAFFVACDPTGSTAQQKGVRIVNGKPMFFTKAKVKKAEQQIARLFAPYAPAAPFEGPLVVEIEFIYPWRASESKATIRHCRCVPKDTRVDLTNAVKVVEDQMTKLKFWGDDSQIARLVLVKVWADEPGIRVSIRRANTVYR